MVRYVVSGLRSKQKWVKANREVIHAGRNANSGWNIGGLKCSSQFISYYHGSECAFRLTPVQALVLLRKESIYKLLLAISGRSSLSGCCKLTVNGHVEGSSRSDSSGGGRQAASDHAARTQLQAGSTLKEAVTKLMDRLKNSDAYNHVLQWCSKEKDLELVKQVHDSVNCSQMEQDLYVTNMLLKCDMECGRLETAQELFNILLKKKNITLNMMIAGFAKHDEAQGASDMYKQMRNEDAREATALVQMSSKTGLIADAKQVKSKCGKGGRNAYSRSNIGGLRYSSQFVRSCMNGHGEGSSRSNPSGGGRQAASHYAPRTHLQDGSTLKEAVTKLIDCANRGISVNSYAYSHVLQRCSKEKDLESVKQVHDFARDSQMEQDPYVASMLLKCYFECGRLETAQELFSKLLKKDTVTWTVMIAGCVKHDQAEVAIELYKQMRDEGVQPNEVTYLSLLKACASPTAIKWRKDIHAHIINDGFQADVRVATALVQMYAKTGLIADAKQMFDKMRNRNVITWNVMIGGLAEQGLGHEAFSLFLQMQRDGVTPDAITYLSILNPCSSAGAVEWLKEVHAHALEKGSDVDVRVGTALVQMYAKIGLIADAKEVFEKMRIRNVICWNVMIGELAEQGLGHEAFSLFLRMQREGIAPDAITFLNILNPSSGAGAVGWLKEVHTYALKTGLNDDVRVGNALVQMYAKSGLIADAKQVFKKMRIRNVISWNGMIGELAEQGLGHEAFSLFVKMQREGIAPNAITYLSILNPCSSAGGVEWLKDVHAHALKAGLDDDVRVGNALVQMYAKTGLIADAKQVFGEMRIRDVISWNVMIGGLAQHGHGREALQLSEEMVSEGVKPNDATFVAVLAACSHAGLVEEGRSQFVSMMRDYGIEPELEHYTCVIDMLGRAGRLKEAQLFLLNMPIKPDVVIWKAFLGSCRIHQNVELAELAATECVKLRPTDAAANVLLSNLYSSVGSWDQVSLIRRRMQDRGVRKDPGWCSIQVGNKVHEFLVGDTSHPETREIYNMLSSLSEKLKVEGYVPDTRLVLRNIAEEDKESAICSHSEKLAIAYGLMHLPPGEPIRVYKNLRICTDCHAATKLISKTTGREIVARDANRFHHFKGGSCSCGDYW